MRGPGLQTTVVIAYLAAITLVGEHTLGGTVEIETPLFQVPIPGGCNCVRPSARFRVYAPQVTVHSGTAIVSTDWLSTPQCVAVHDHLNADNTSSDTGALIIPPGSCPSQLSAAPAGWLRLACVLTDGVDDEIRFQITVGGLCKLVGTIYDETKLESEWWGQAAFDAMQGQRLTFFTARVVLCVSQCTSIPMTVDAEAYFTFAESGSCHECEWCFGADDEPPGGDGLPDACQGLPPDTNGDGVIDVNDLVGVITHWGSASPVYDVASPYGVVDVNDLVAVIVNWG